MLIKGDEKCQACGRARSEWRVNNSEGVAKDGQVYCCEGCAEGRECSCSVMQAATRPLKNVDPSV